MIPQGVAWATFFKLYGALAAVTALIFLLRFARRGRAVSSTLIWEKVMRTGRSLWRELLSFLVQLAILFFICLALVDLQPPPEKLHRRWVGLIFDASESMAARDGDASRLRRAQREGWRLISQLGPADRAMVVSASADAEALTPFTADHKELTQALARLQVNGARPKIAEAVTYLLSAFDYAEINAQDEKHLYVLTDRPDEVTAPSAPGVDFRVLGIGQSAANLAITSFDVRRTLNMTDMHEALVRVRNFSPSNVSAELALFTPEQRLGTETVALPPGGVFAKVIGLPFGTAGKVTAVLEKVRFTSGAKDALASDDVAFAFVPPSQRARVLLVTKSNPFLYNALALNPEVELTAVKPGEYQQGLSANADVAIFDNFTPPTLPACNAVYFHPGQGGPFTIKEEKAKPETTGWADGHPLLRHVRLDTLSIDSARILVPGPADVVLMGHFENALMLLRPVGGRFLLGVGFDLAKTDLPLYSAFPIFLHNIVHVFSHQETEDPITDYRLGELVEIHLSAPKTEVVLVDPLRRQINVPVRGALALFRPTVPGFYVYADAGISRAFAANLLDEDESNLTVAPTEAPPVLAGKTANKAAEGPRPWLILAALALIAVDMVLFFNGRIS